MKNSSLCPLGEDDSGYYRFLKADVTKVFVGEIYILMNFGGSVLPIIFSFGQK